MKGYTDFLMLLSPSERVKHEVNLHKTYAADIIGDYKSRHSIAHITIKKIPRQRSFLTEPGILDFRRRLCLIPPISLTVNGFDHFNHGNDVKTIYARLVSSPETNHWFKMLKKHLHHKDFLVPHITICRNIAVSDFEKLWPYFKSLEFNETFTVNALTVLQRETFATFATWKPYTELNFESKTPYSLSPKPSLLKPVQNLQTSLF